jgi:glycogen operon protein
MFLAGDEFGRTQGGNNNAYCQDNATSWVDWSLLAKNAELHRFLRAALSLRKRHAVLRHTAFYTERDTIWFSCEGTAPVWHRPEARQLGWLLLENDEPALCLLFNAGEQTSTFSLPAPPGHMRWHVAADTYQASPRDIAIEEGEATPVLGSTFAVGPRSSVVMVALVESNARTAASRVV